MVIDYRLFYLIGLFGKLSVILLLLLIVGTVIYIFTFINYTDARGYKDDELEHLMKKIIKRYIINATIILITFILIPSRETMYKMLIFKNLTYDNIEKTQQNIKETVDYIFEKIENLNNDK